MIYAYIKAHDEYPVVKWARYFGVSTSGYYEWKRDLAKRQGRYQTYRDAVEQVFDEGRGTYGSERICGVLRQRGHRASFQK